MKTFYTALAIIVTLAGVGLHAQEILKRNQPKVSISLLETKQDIGKIAILPNGKKLVLYAERDDYNDILGPRRGAGLTKGWTSEDGQYIGIADYGLYNKVYGTRFTLMNVKREIVWQKDLDHEVIQAGILNNGKIVTLYVGWFDEWCAKRIEVRNEVGDLIKIIPYYGTRGIITYSTNNEYFSLFTKNNYLVFNNKGENIWSYENTDIQNNVISNDGSSAAIFSPGRMASTSMGIKFINKGKVVKHHSITLSPFMRTKGYLSTDDKNLILTDRNTTYLFVLKTGDLIWKKQLGLCVYANWIGDKLLMVVDSSGNRVSKLLNTKGDVLSSELIDSNAGPIVYRSIMEYDNKTGNHYLVMPPKLYVLNIKGK